LVVVGGLCGWAALAEDQLADSRFDAVAADD
jgi:hypothetical protein